jgi:hypothetical protein
MVSWCVPEIQLFMFRLEICNCLFFSNSNRASFKLFPIFVKLSINYALQVSITPESINRWGDIYLESITRFGKVVKLWTFSKFWKNYLRYLYRALNITRLVNDRYSYHYPLVKNILSWISESIHCFKINLRGIQSETSNLLETLRGQRMSLINF